MRIKLLTSIIILLVFSHLHGQTVFWSEDFGTGCSQGNLAAGTITGNGTWNVTSVTAPDAEANKWYVSAPEAGMGVGNCGDGCINNAALTNRTLHIGSVPSSPSAGFFCPTGDCGAAYDSGGGCGFGLGCVAMNDRAESPVINCTAASSYTLSFLYLEGGGDVTNDFMEVMYSANGGTTWTSLTTPGSTNNSGCGAGQGKWTAFSIALPASANNNPNVMIGFRWQNNDDAVGNDPSVAIDDVQLLIPSAALPAVSITPLPNDSICVASTLTLQGNATNPPITAWSWTVSPNAGVVFNPNAAAQNPTVTFTTPGTYTFTLQATNAAGTGSATQVITVLPATTPSVTITANPINPVCAGTTVNFTATASSAGSAPSYTWAVNGTAAGSNSPNFSSSTLNNNDVVTVTVTSNDSCAAVSTASDSYTVQTTAAVVPSVTIAASATTVCQGIPISFTATSTNGGTTPAFQWQVNGVNSGSNSANFSSTFNNGDTIQVILTSNAACPSPTTAVSNTISVVITPTVVPSVTVTVNPANPICPGTTVNFTANISNGGTTPVYQWQVNGVNAGANSPNFTSSTLSNNDVVTLTVTSNAACAIPTTATNSYTIVVVTPTITVQGTPTVCPGVSDTLIASAAPGASFSWTPSAGLNATNNDTAIANIAAPGTYTYYVTASFNGGCSVTDSIQITVNNFTVGVGPAQTICSGDSTNLSVLGGTSWNWSPAQGLSCTSCQNPVASPTATTTYTSVVSNGVCTTTVTQMVTVFPNAVAAFDTSIVSQGIPQVISFTNMSTNANSFFWTLGNGNTSILQTPANQTYPMAGTYTVTLIAYGANGCNDTTYKALLVIDTVGVTVPNIFTPNGDEINDVWQPSAHGVTSFECTIFNRWGIMVYDFINAQDKWDGHTTAGLACTEGTYYYILKATDKNNKSYNLKGFIQLIR